MSSPLLVFLQQLLEPEPEEPRGRQRDRGRSRLAHSVPGQATSTIFLVLRRMRAPLIVLIAIYAFTVLGLTMMPGVDAEGRPWKMSIFHAFYFMSYTATTIGFGEIPYAFSDAQRMWVTFSIYLTVIGWAYAIGTMLAMLQDRSFRQALAVRRFASRVRALKEPFVLVAGYGRAGRRLARSLDAIGRRFVVVDVAQDRIDELALEPFRVDAPALAIDARNPDHLMLAGLGSPACATVVALTGDDEANLAVTMAAALQRPGLPVIARAESPVVVERMRAFGAPVVVNPFDLYGDYLRIALRAPSSLQLIEWISADPQASRPPLRTPPRGRWIVCGYGRFGAEVAADLRAEGLEVTVIEAAEATADDPAIITGSVTESDVLASARPQDAVALVAATDNDTTNLSVIAEARKLNPALYIVARQNQPPNAPLFRAVRVDFAMIASQILVHEILPVITAPLLARFLAAVPDEDDAWAAALVSRLEQLCGERVPSRWRVRLDAEDAPALLRWFTSKRTLTIGELLRERGEGGGAIPAVPLMLARGKETVLAPGDEVALAPGDEIVFAGRSSGRRALAQLCRSDAVRDWVLLGRAVPSGWVWRRFAGTNG